MGWKRLTRNGEGTQKKKCIEWGISFKSDPSWACRKTYKIRKLAGVVAQGETTTDNGSAQGGLQVAILTTYLVTDGWVSLRLNRSRLAFIIVMHSWNSTNVVSVLMAAVGSIAFVVRESASDESRARTELTWPETIIDSRRLRGRIYRTSDLVSLECKLAYNLNMMIAFLKVYEHGRCNCDRTWEYSICRPRECRRGDSGKDRPCNACY